jgi:hypothetical protein
MTDVPIEHHPTSRYMVYNGYYKVMSNIPKMGQLPTPALWIASVKFGATQMVASATSTQRLVGRSVFLRCLWHPHSTTMKHLTTKKWCKKKQNGKTYIMCIYIYVCVFMAYIYICNYIIYSETRYMHIYNYIYINKMSKINLAFTSSPAGMLKKHLLSLDGDGFGMCTWSARMSVTFLSWGIDILYRDMFIFLEKIWNWYVS